MILDDNELLTTSRSGGTEVDLKPIPIILNKRASIAVLASAKLVAEVTSIRMSLVCSVI